MVKETAADPTIRQEQSSAKSTDAVPATLERFAVIRNPLLSWLVAYLPLILALLLLVDLLDGVGAFAKDWFRLSWVLTIIVEVLVVNMLFRDTPKVLGVIWSRGLVTSWRNAQPVEMNFLGYLRRFETALNHRAAWLIGALFAIGALIATYPISFLLKYHTNPYSSQYQWLGFYVGSGALLEVPLGYFLGLLVWRYGVIAGFIAQIGGKFELKIQPSHPDRCGGLKPLGDLCLMNAFLILVPVFMLSAWVTIGTHTGFEVYGIWGDPYKKLLIALSVVSAVFFFQPLYRIHQQMERQRGVIQLDLDELSLRMENLSLKLRQDIDNLASDEINKRLDALKAMGEVYQKDSQIPTWPFDWVILMKLVSAQIIPVLSLSGVSGPIIEVIKPMIHTLFP